MKSYIYLLLLIGIGFVLCFLSKRYLLTKCSENIWHRCPIVASVSFHRKFLYRQSRVRRIVRTVEKFPTRLALLSVHEVILKSFWFPRRSPAHNGLVRTRNKIRLSWNIRPLHITICYFSTVSSVDAGIGRWTSPRRATGDVGRIGLF